MNLGEFCTLMHGMKKKKVSRKRADGYESVRWSWLRGVDLNHRPLGYEPNELPDCSTPQIDHSSGVQQGQTTCSVAISICW